MNLKRGDVVRPVVRIATLDARRMYRVEHVERPSPFASLVFLEGCAAPIENGHLVLETVSTATLKPAAALFN